MIKAQMFIGAALFAGVAIGYFAGGRGNVVGPPDKEDRYVAKSAVADKGGAASIQALRARIAELERLLAEKGDGASPEISNGVAASVDQPREPERPRGSMQEWMENLRKNDPERYVQMTNRFAQGRQRRAELAQSRIDFLSSIDTSRMSAAAKQIHADLQDLIVRRVEIEEQLHQEGVTDEQRHRLMDEMRETSREERRLNGQERNNLLREVARNLGVKGEKAQELTATIREVIEATDGGFSWGGHGGHGPPHGSPPGGARGGPGGR